MKAHSGGYSKKTTRKTEHASQKKLMNIQHRNRKEGRKTRRFNIKRKAAIRNWHSRARLIDIRKTKITLIGHEESHINHFDEREEQAVATPVTVVGGTGEIRATLTQGLDSSQQTGEQIEGTPVEISPM